MFQETASNKVKTIKCVDEGLTQARITRKGANIEFAAGNRQIEILAALRRESNINYRG